MWLKQRFGSAGLALVLGLGGCPKAGGETPQVSGDAVVGWIRVSPLDPGLCVSAVPSAGKIKEGMEGLRRTMDALQVDPLKALQTMRTLEGEHPAFGAARAAAAWGLRDAPAAREELRDLANTWPTDPCLQAGLARVYADLGALRLAHAHAATAVELSGGEADFAYLHGLLLMAEGDHDRAAGLWRAALQANPEHPAINAQLGALYVSRGDFLLALPLLERASAAGLPVDQALAQAALGAGQMGPYLGAASRAGAPLGDGGAVGKAADPEAAFRALLGVGEDGRLEARIQTAFGPLRCELLWQEAPITVANFVGLARGSQPWRDPRTGEPGNGPLYDNTTFHRLIPEFMIQSGDPLGDGTGGPGYQFGDELTSGRTFDRPGLLAMANAGPGTNGSQWFITEVPVPHLNGRHTIFGICDEPTLERVRTIARQPRAPNDRPTEPIRVERIEVVPYQP